MIGYLGVSLPLLVWLGGGWRTVDGFPGWGLLGSISAYYHTGATVIFTGALVALGVFLLTYRGYDNEAHHLDRRAAWVAGVSALLVAFFPTRHPNWSPDRLPNPFWWAEWMHLLHLAAAAVLFLAFAYFSLVLFTKEHDAGRNRIYIGCGIGILVSLAWALVNFNADSIFWPETFALLFFGTSWLVKGRAERTARRAASRLIIRLKPVHKR